MHADMCVLYLCISVLLACSLMAAALGRNILAAACSIRRTTIGAGASGKADSASDSNRRMERCSCCEGRRTTSTAATPRAVGVNPNTDPGSGPSF